VPRKKVSFESNWTIDDGAWMVIKKKENFFGVRLTASSWFCNENCFYNQVGDKKNDWLFSGLRLIPILGKYFVI